MKILVDKRITISCSTEGSSNLVKHIKTREEFTNFDVSPHLVAHQCCAWSMIHQELYN